MDDLMAFHRDTLVVLKGLQAAAGVEIIDELDACSDSEVFPGRFYPSIEILVEAGFIDKDLQDGRTNLYSLTENGEQTLARHRAWIEQQLNGSV